MGRIVGGAIPFEYKSTNSTPKSSSYNYPINTLKLTWVDPNDFTILESKMFKDGELPTLMDEAQKNNQKKYLVFQLIRTNGTSYSWKLLPYGSHREFLTAMNLSRSTLFHIIALTIIGFAIYGIYKVIKR